MRVIETQPADVDLFGGYHHLSGVVGLHHHHIDFGHRLGRSGARLGRCVLCSSGVRARLGRIVLRSSSVRACLGRVGLSRADRAICGRSGCGCRRLCFAQCGLGCLGSGLRLRCLGLGRLYFGLCYGCFLAVARCAQRRARCSRNRTCRY